MTAISIKCPQCGLINFSTDGCCKRCQADLAHSAQTIQRESAARAQMSRKQNLSPCPDCDHLISRHAASCPNCGRFIQNYPVTVERAGWTGTVAWGIILSGLLLIAINAAIILLLVMLAGLASTAAPRG